MGKRVKIALALSLIVLGGVIFGLEVRPGHNRNPAYIEFLRTQRLGDRFERYRFSWTYQTVSRLTGFDPARHYRLKAQEEELALWKSGGLVSLTFWAPYSKALADVRTAKHFLKVMARDSDTISLSCLPEDVADLQSLFCCITNRVPMAPLARLAGFNKEDIACRLPDGSVVDLEGLQKWLNDSVAAGWSVGVAREGGLLATRQRLQPQTKPEDPRNRSSVGLDSSAGKKM